MDEFMNDPIIKKTKAKAKGVTFNGDTFKLTNIGLEGGARTKSEKEKVPEPEPEPEPEINLHDVVDNMDDMAKGYDDLEELRRMIRETKKEMKSYGKDLLGLKNTISDLNEFATKELGYSASSHHLVNVEYNLNELKDKKGFKYIKKNAASTTNLKAASTLTRGASSSSSTNDTSRTSSTFTGAGMTIATSKPMSGTGFKIRTTSYYKKKE
jgi:hypothetical protein